ncbi:MAG: oligosaccharide flippase family protein [Proteobacteria bacterium]|nr:oligosaccharide flippase family protein [Pseudomonadota bacterium]
MSAQPDSQPAPAARVLRNTSLLVIAQVIVTPLSILINAVAGRTLGAASFGLLYQALTFSSLVFLFVEWGQSNVLTGRVARQQTAAGELLGSGILLRVTAAAAALVIVPLVCALVGYDREFLVVLELAMLAATFATVSAACQDVFRGYERTDFAAASYVGWQLLSAAVVIPTLLAGGGLRGLLVAQVSCAAFGMLFVLKMLPRMQVPKLVVRRAVARELFRSGHPFILFGLVILLQPMVDAAMLSKFAAPASMGWYAAARKLVGILIFPASALIAALYPTLCRLYAENRNAWRKTAGDALFGVSLVVIPVALGCGLFPEVGVAIFGQRDFGPAADDLRLLAPFVFLVYFSMVIGSCLVSSGRQNGWTVVQLGSVVISAALDPPLISWFQAHYANGGLGVCTAAVISEVLMVTGGFLLLPKGILASIPRASVGRFWGLVRRRT